MPRPTQQLFAFQPPSPAQAAATLLLLRDADGSDPLTPAGSLEVLMTRRSPAASFVPGAWVFPGGAIDAADHQAHDLAVHRPTQHSDRITQSITAVREAFEELGVLLARHGDGCWASMTDVQALARTPHDAQAFFDRLRMGKAGSGQGLRLAIDGVHALAQWVGARDIKRRFDTAFFVARMPPDQQPVADGVEQFEPLWITPQRALQRHHAGDFLLIYPTIRTLERLQAWRSTEEALAACAAHEEPLWRSCPRAGMHGGHEQRFMEHESAFGELALVCPDGQALHALDWQTERAVPLLRNLMRLTAPNPGVMTGPGTNSYLVGDPDCGYIVIDPGPADSQHLERLWRAAGGRINMIVCTHSHPDHAPGARPLQAMCEPTPPVLGLPSASTARAASHFVPDRKVQHGEALVLQTPWGGPRHTLKVLHTPGHAANHLCLLLLEDGVLFSGDHVLNGSTTVIDPPDGDMDHYMASLDLLQAQCIAHEVHFIAPAHGYVMGGPPEPELQHMGGRALACIAGLKAHRLKREAKVQAAMQSLPQGSLEDWLRLAYDDVPERLWPVAQRSLLAHVQRIRALAA